MPTQFVPDKSKLSEADLLSQQVFIERGLASLEAAKKSGVYFSSDVVLWELDEILARATQKKHQ